MIEHPCLRPACLSTVLGLPHGFKGFIRKSINKCY